MTSPDDATLIALATATADRLVERASERGVTSPNERDYLQPSCLDAARALAVESVSRGIDLQVRTNLRMRSNDWPRLGAVDIALTADEKTTAVELKAGTGRHALVACAWDAVKLSFALQLDLVSSAYVLALAPTDDWADARGGEFFGTATFETAPLRDKFADGWKLWERDGYPAGRRVPSSFATQAVCRVPIRIAGRGWEIRAAAVHRNDPAEWIEWDVLHPSAPADRTTNDGEAGRQKSWN